MQQVNTCVCGYIKLGQPYSKPHHRSSLVKSIFLIVMFACLLDMSSLSYIAVWQINIISKMCMNPLCVNHNRWVCHSSANHKLLPYHMNKLLIYRITGRVMFSLYFQVQCIYRSKRGCVGFKQATYTQLVITILHINLCRNHILYLF